MRTAVLAFVVALGSPLAEAAERSDLVVAVPTARGPAKYGKIRVTEGVRRGLAPAFSKKVDVRSLEAVRRRRRKALRKFRPSALARLGREVNADYVVDLALSRRGRRYTVRARLIRATDGAVQMDERLRYRRPKSEAGPRGKRLAARILDRLTELLEAGGTPLALAPAEVAVGPGPKPAAAPEPPPPAPDLLTAPDPEPAVPDPVDSPPSPPPAQQVVAAARPSRRDTFEFSLGAGAGFLRTYDLTSAEGISPLGYTLDPVSLIELQAALRIPRTGLVLGGRGGLRLVGYRLVDANGQPDAPQGQILDLEASLGWAFGSEVLTLTPRVGFRYGMGRVEAHAGPILLDTTLSAVTAGLAGGAFLDPRVEVRASIDGGWVLGYEEQPATTGDMNSGISVAASLALRIWLSEGVGVAIDGRFLQEEITFSGTATRVGGPLVDARLTRRDLLGSMGLAARF